MPAVAKEQTPVRLFLQGLLVATTNPKSILFFTALLPQFMTPHAPVLPQFAHETRARWFNRIAGALFGALGIGIGVLRLRNSAI